MSRRRRSPGTTALAVALLALGATADAARHDWLPPEPEPAASVSVSRRGFAPAVLHARRDEPATLRVRAEDGEHCFALDDFRVEKRLRPGVDVEVKFTADRAGRFTVHCCLHEEEPAAELVVVD